MEKNNLKESEPHFLNKKVKRSVNENDDDNSSLEIKKKNKKKKIENVDFEYISDSNLEGNDKNESEKNDLNNSDYLDN